MPLFSLVRRKPRRTTILLQTRMERTANITAISRRRLVALLKGPQLKKGLPRMLDDAREHLDTLAAQPTKITDPINSIYRIIFQFTMRTVACGEIADDPARLWKCLDLYEKIEKASTPFQIMFPWMPLFSKLQRTYAGAQLYMIFKKVIDDRTKTGRREDDPLQFLLDHGDSVTDIVTFVLGSQFAGQVNSGINAAWVCCHLANKPYCWNRVLEEVTSVADRYCPDKSIALKDRLMRVPIEAWEGEFPIIDICLKDSIRLQTSGTAFRRNLSGEDIPLGNGEVIPKGMFAALAAGDIHLNPEIYEDPLEWDPSRYLPERAEDKKQEYGWFGWGVARHPCLGMRFAKLEMNVIAAMFVAYFDNVEICDYQGKKMDDVPRMNHNAHVATKPDIPLFLKYQLRDD